MAGTVESSRGGARPRRDLRRPMETWSRRADLASLPAAHGTPLYLVDAATLRRNVERYLALVGDPAAIRYPVKANPSPVVLERLAALGLGADCASRLEVRRALDAGVAVDRIGYYTPDPDPSFAAWLLREGGTVIADSVELLAELAGRLDGEAPRGRLAARVHAAGVATYREASPVQRFTAHGGVASPFGIPAAELVAFLGDYPLPLRGLHVHAGTQMDHVDAFVSALRFLHDVAGRIAGGTPHRIEVLNLGGGLGIPMLRGDAFPPIEALADAVRPLRRPGFRYEAEPGASLVGDAVALVARIVGVKSIGGRRCAIADVGTDQLVKHTIARWEHEIVDAAGRPLAREGPDVLVGPLCFAGDVLLPATRLDGIRRGDLIVVRHVGAYCEAVANQFNGRRGPATVVLEDGGRPWLARSAADPFFDPGVLAHRPAGLMLEDAGEVIDPARIAALASRYMQREARRDRYTIVDARRTGTRAYRFTFEPRTTVGFVAMPLALRMVGDASMMALGIELGWAARPGPVWASRLAMVCGSMLRDEGRLPCRIALGAIGPSPRPDAAAVATVHFRLGDGEVSGAARMVVPASEPVNRSVATGGRSKP